MASNLLRISMFCFILYINLHLNANSVAFSEESCNKVNAPECNQHGNYKCDGTCECDAEYFGRRCECAADPSYSNIGGGCTGPNSSFACSGKGQCICNQCECDMRENPNEVISGKWCECDNYSCDRYNGEICGGHGTCDCGRCVCIPPWTGDACECYNANNTCYPPFKENPQLCDGHGDCHCGTCRCHSTEEGKYTGRYCERCPNCTETCVELAPCVLCQMYQTGPYDDETCVKKCGKFTPEEVDVVKADEQNDEFRCAGFDQDGCGYVFAYKKISETHYRVKAQGERECPLSY